MLKILGKIPKKVSIALSGGVDSMVALDFVRKGGADVTALYFNHGTSFGQESESFLKEWCHKNSVNLVIGNIDSNPPARSSLEDFWRKKRYAFLQSATSDVIITAHHIGDVMETWLFSSLNGNPKVIPYRRNNFIRPFLLCDKEQILDWATRKGLHWMEDPSNEDINFTRNYIRHNLMPHALAVNPGLKKVMRKKVLAEFRDVKSESLCHI